jgi:DNA polymerase-3 subunit epsilon
MDFVAIDFETTNADCSSVCQVGAVTFRNGEAVDEFTRLVDPRDRFDPVNIATHGIDAERVRGAPRFPDIHADLSSFVQDRVVVSHMPFDRAVFQQVHAKYGLGAASCRWLDTAMVARRAWPQ